MTPKVFSRQSALVPKMQSRTHILVSVSQGDLCYLYTTGLWIEKQKKEKSRYAKL